MRSIKRINVLEMAIRSNSPIELIQFFLDRGFDVNDRRVTALGFWEHGIELQIKTKLLAAIENKNSILEKIYSGQYDSQELESLDKELQNSTEIIELLIDRGADIDHIKWEGHYYYSQTENGIYENVQGSWLNIDIP